MVIKKVKAAYKRSTEKINSRLNGQNLYIFVTIFYFFSSFYITLPKDDDRLTMSNSLSLCGINWSTSIKSGLQDNIITRVIQGLSVIFTVTSIKILIEVVRNSSSKISLFSDVLASHFMNMLDFINRIFIFTKMWLYDNRRNVMYICFSKALNKQ